MHRSTFIASRQAVWMHRGMKREDTHRIAELEAGDMGDLLEDVPPVSIEAETDDLDPLTITTADASLSFSGKRSNQ